MRADVSFDDKWIAKDFDIIFSAKTISSPEPYVKFIEIPGSSDTLDLTENLTGDVEYKQRKITFKFESTHGKDKYFSDYSKLMNYMHGRKMKIVFAKDPGYYWIGRISVTGSDQKYYGSTITVEATVDPYKYETQSSLDDWEWDSFSFEDGIIRGYKDIAVPGTVTIAGRRKRVCPKFVCSGAMTVTYLGNSYNLSAGENLIPDIFLGEGEHVLTFGGSGTVSIDYRGASL